VDLCLVLGGDGTMLRGFHLTRDLGIPVAGVNLGRVGFLTTILSERLEEGLDELLAGAFTEHSLLGLRARLGESVFRATNDAVVGKGDRSDASSLSLRINGVTLFEVLCDGVVVGTPAGSSAYSLAAGGPLLGISVDAYVISLVAPHAVGVRPVVAAPDDVLEITNTARDEDCSMDVDGQRVAVIPPGAVLEIRTEPGVACLALLEGDSLYHHFRDRLL
jgi:NAD+ kinase